MTDPCGTPCLTLDQADVMMHVTNQMSDNITQKLKIPKPATVHDNKPISSIYHPYNLTP